MPLIINTNVTALNAQRHLTTNSIGLSKSMEKLASGYRINRAGDDAACLQLSEKLRTQIRGSKKALDNVQDGINFVNVVEGAFAAMQEIFQRVRELLVQGANDTYSTAARQAIDQEMAQHLTEFTRIVNSTQWNGKKVLTAAYNNVVMRLQVGPNASVNNDTVLIHNSAIFALFGDMSLPGLGVNSWANGTFELIANPPPQLIPPRARAWQLMTEIDNGIRILGNHRRLAGALVNRLEGVANNLMINIENLSASESRIRNVDVASEAATLTKHQILQQASTSILAQASQAPSLALQLLQGK